MSAIVIERLGGEVPSSGYLTAHPPRYRLHTETRIGQPLEQVFAFFSDAQNLAKITPPDLGFQIVTPTPIEMRQGTLIDYRIRVMGLPLRWRTLIEVWEPPNQETGAARFVDAQLRGPYACWWHEHRFAAQGAETLMTDTVLYAPPLGPLGRVAQRLMVARELRRIFEHRASFIRSSFR